jgi:hypothetical protein
MNVTLTPEGERAFALAESAFDDHGKIPGVRDALAQMSGRATGQALKEVGSAAQMVLRLAGSLEPAGRNISDQMTGEPGG